MYSKSHNCRINIDYYMAFFIAYPLSARELIGSRDDKGYDMKNYMLICLSYTSTEEITDLYQNV
jgi:hypothetical protein